MLFQTRKSVGDSDNDKKKTMAFIELSIYKIKQ